MRLSKVTILEVTSSNGATADQVAACRDRWVPGWIPTSEITWADQSVTSEADIERRVNEAYEMGVQDGKNEAVREAEEAKKKEEEEEVQRYQSWMDDSLYDPLS